MARFRFGRWGMLDNPVGTQVKFRRDGREQLADVVGFYRRETPQAYMLRLQHFNGEDAGEIAASAVEVLERTYEAQS